MAGPVLTARTIAIQRIRRPSVRLSRQPAVPRPLATMQRYWFKASMESGVRNGPLIKVGTP